MAVEGGGEGEGGGDADHRDRFRWCLFCENLLRLFLPLFVQLLDLVAAGKLLCMSEWWVSAWVGCGCIRGEVKRWSVSGVVI